MGQRLVDVYGQHTGSGLPLRLIGLCSLQVRPCHAAMPYTAAV
jgi:hypothetical protein